MHTNNPDRIIQSDVEFEPRSVGNHLGAAYTVGVTIQSCDGCHLPLFSQQSYYPESQM